MKKLILLFLVIFFPSTIIDPLLYVSAEGMPAPIVVKTYIKTDYELLMEFIEELPEYVQKRFLAVVECESNFKQFEKDGTVRTSSTNDIGIMQINKKTWGAEALKRGIDIYTTKGNIEMARIVYKQQGIEAWVCASK